MRALKLRAFGHKCEPVEGKNCSGGEGATMRDTRQLKTNERLRSRLREISSLSLWTLLIIGCLTVYSVGNALAAAVYPQNTIYNGPKNVPSIPRPGYLQPITDPVFGTKVTRISDESTFGGSANHRLQHLYSKTQPWNSDMTLIQMHSARVILDAKTYQVVKIQSGRDEAKWSTVEPNILYYVSGNQFRKWNVRTNADTVLHTFSEGNISMGDYEGNISVGDTYVVFNVGALAIVYDIVNDTVISKKDLGPADWVSMSQSGNYVVARVNPKTLGALVYDRNLNYLRTVFDHGSHGDLGYDGSGNEIYAQVCSGKGRARLDNGLISELMPGFNECGHISLRSYKRPGWALKSGDGEVYAIKLDGSGIVQRFAHEHSSSVNYDAEPKGAISPDGSKVMWNSDWGSGTVYAYVAEMPVSSGDTVPPAAPTELKVTGILQTEINLSWNDSRDIVGVTNYLASHGDSQIATVTDRSQSNMGLSAGIQFRHAIVSPSPFQKTGVQTLMASAKARLDTIGSSSLYGP